MSSVDTGKDTKSADMLAEIMQHILANQAGKTGDNNFTQTVIIPLGDGFDLDDAVSVTGPLPLWFEITNDAGGGTTTAQHAGKIGQSIVVILNAPQITDTSGWGAGVMVEGKIDDVTAVLIDDLTQT